MKGPIHFVTRKFGADFEQEYLSCAPDDVNERRTLLGLIVGEGAIMSYIGGNYLSIDDLWKTTNPTGTLSAVGEVALNIVGHVPALTLTGIGLGIVAESVAAFRKVGSEYVPPEPS